MQQPAVHETQEEFRASDMATEKQLENTQHLLTATTRDLNNARRECHSAKRDRTYWHQSTTKLRPGLLAETPGLPTSRLNFAGTRMTILIPSRTGTEVIDVRKGCQDTRYQFHN